MLRRGADGCDAGRCLEQRHYRNRKVRISEPRTRSAVDTGVGLLAGPRMRARTGYPADTGASEFAPSSTPLLSGRP